MYVTNYALRIFTSQEYKVLLTEKEPGIVDHQCLLSWAYASRVRQCNLCIDIVYIVARHIFEHTEYNRSTHDNSNYILEQIIWIWVQWRLSRSKIAKFRLNLEINLWFGTISFKEMILTYTYNIYELHAKNLKLIEDKLPGSVSGWVYQISLSTSRVGINTLIRGWSLVPSPIIFASRCSKISWSVGSNLAPIGSTDSIWIWP